MASNISTAFGNFVGSISTIGIAFAHSVTALFMAVLAFGQSIVSSVLHLVQAVILLGLDVFKGALGFLTANFFAIALLGGGYYWWSSRKQGRTGTGGGPRIRSQK
ncbi:hypothetical protein HETIRDRAFT_306956 [Heterobasidion irregulare TC 32-1]|uniref:Uncharacterized protein n=1 Tax=Heterobasidion irregulare (strain TC 32-1) TaxID=747525 RepID=W4KR24_HETIT|nr:uncharacterized protein HETIRDRAFT_306956 [Heterobasidion irregulare TC 32-1]ETW87516.1 hypothetical protein HETIRDRAFT_306956 [Heterobasidion irregulare TC 32-1]